MATRTVNGNEFTKTDLDSRLRWLNEPKELSALLNEVLDAFCFTKSRPAQLRFFANTYNTQRRCRTFRLRKKHGGYREIIAPKGKLRDILHALNIVLQTFDDPTPWAYGFVCGRSVVDNARPHVGKRYVLGLDLKDFFPSITRRQVADCLTTEPLGFSPVAADLVAGLASVRTDEGQEVLAQGFATSPTLSNFVCREMDREIADVAAAQSITFTRYADDLTFSSDADILRPQGAFVQQIKTIVERHGFRLNEAKTHLQRRGRRQEVTGLMVTEKVNVSRRYVREVRSLLYIWERYGYENACKAAWKSYKLQHGKTKGHLHHVPLNRVLAGKLNYMKMIRGASDPLYQRLAGRYAALRDANRDGIMNVEYNAYMGEYVPNSHRRRPAGDDGLYTENTAGRHRRSGTRDIYSPERKGNRILKFILKVAMWAAIILAYLYFRSR